MLSRSMLPSLARRLRPTSGPRLCLGFILSLLALATSGCGTSPKSTESTESTSKGPAAVTSGTAAASATTTPATNPASSPATSPGLAPAPATAPASTPGAKPTPASSPAAVPVTPPAGAGAAPGAASSPQAEAITAATKRTASGLPEAVSSYLSWLRLGRAVSPPAGTAAGHWPLHRTYAHIEGKEGHETGTSIATPLSGGSLLILEEKAPGKDFIGRVGVMSRPAPPPTPAVPPELPKEAAAQGSWKFEEYSREASGEPFSPSKRTLAECSSCHHAKAQATDAIFSALKVE